MCVCFSFSFPLSENTRSVDNPLDICLYCRTNTYARLFSNPSIAIHCIQFADVFDALESDPERRHCQQTVIEGATDPNPPLQLNTNEDTADVLGGFIARESKKKQESFNEHVLCSGGKQVTSLCFTPSQP